MVGVVRLSGGDDVEELVCAVREVNRESWSRGDLRTSDMLSGVGRDDSVGVAGLLAVVDGGKEYVGTAMGDWLERLDVVPVVVSGTVDPMPSISNSISCAPGENIESPPPEG